MRNSLNITSEYFVRNFITIALILSILIILFIFIPKVTTKPNNPKPQVTTTNLKFLKINSASAYLLETGTETAIDASIDLLIGYVTGTPPAWYDNFINFGMNAIPGAGEINTGKKFGKLGKTINNIRLKLNNVVNCKTLLKDIDNSILKLKNNIYNGKFQEAKQTVSYLTGDLFELRVLTKRKNITFANAHKMDICKHLKIDKRKISGFNSFELDYIAKRNDIYIFGQAKSNAPFDRRRFKKIKKQLEMTVNFAKEAKKQGKNVEVEFVFDNTATKELINVIENYSKEIKITVKQNL